MGVAPFANAASRPRGAMRPGYDTRIVALFLAVRYVPK
jgi:hypothetical protein